MIAVSEYRLTKSFCTLVFVAVFPFSTSAQVPETSTPARRTIQATRIADDERIEVDGVLDEAAWARALAARDVIQIDPANGAPATEPTEVRVIFTKDAIYMGVTCYDSEPDKWLGYQRRRDEFLPADDRFMWTIDTFLDERSGYFFEMNPSGLMADSLFGVNGDNRAWDGIWNARVVRSEIGWTIEIEIPFRTLNFDPDNDTWGFNFQRTVRRKNEDSIWMGWARNQGLRRMTNAGHVTGIREVTQGVGLDIKPYGLLTSEFSTGLNGHRSLEKANGGVDLFYNPTPGVRANLRSIRTSRRQRSISGRSTSRVSRSSFPSVATSSSTAQRSSISPATASAARRFSLSSAGELVSVPMPRRKRSTSAPSSPGRWGAMMSACCRCEPVVATTVSSSRRTSR